MRAAVIASLSTNGRRLLLLPLHVDRGRLGRRAGRPHLDSARAGLQFWFENGVGGYFGTQVWREGATDGLGRTNDGRTAVAASVWDAPDAEVGWRGDTCGRFGGEGVGSHCVASFRSRTTRSRPRAPRRPQRHRRLVDGQRDGPSRLRQVPDTTVKAFAADEGVRLPRDFEATASVSSVGLGGPWWRGERAERARVFGSYAPNCPPPT